MKYNTFRIVAARRTLIEFVCESSPIKAIAKQDLLEACQVCTLQKLLSILFKHFFLPRRYRMYIYVYTYTRRPSETCQCKRAPCAVLGSVGRCNVRARDKILIVSREPSRR